MFLRPSSLKSREEGLFPALCLTLQGDVGCTVRPLVNEHVGNTTEKTKLDRGNKEEKSKKTKTEDRYLKRNNGSWRDIN